MIPFETIFISNTIHWQSVYGRATLHRTGSLEEHAREVVKHLESQSKNMRLTVLEELPSSSTKYGPGNASPRR